MATVKLVISPSGSGYANLDGYGRTSTSRTFNITTGEIITVKVDDSFDTEYSYDYAEYNGTEKITATTFPVPVNSNTTITVYFEKKEQEQVWEWGEFAGEYSNSASGIQTLAEGCIDYLLFTPDSDGKITFTIQHDDNDICLYACVGDTAPDDVLEDPYNSENYDYYVDKRGVGYQETLTFSVTANEIYEIGWHEYEGLESEFVEWELIFTPAKPFFEGFSSPYPLADEANVFAKHVNDYISTISNYTVSTEDCIDDSWYNKLATALGVSKVSEGSYITYENMETLVDAYNNA